jgi:hypothetical protein
MRSNESGHEFRALRRHFQCKSRARRTRLKGFEPSTFCMASSSSRSQIAPKCLQIDGYFLG